MKRLSPQQRRTLVIVLVITMCTISLSSLIYLSFFHQGEVANNNYGQTDQLAYHSSQPGTPAMHSIAHDFKGQVILPQTMRTKHNTTNSYKATQYVHETSDALTQHVGSGIGFVGGNGFGLQMGQSKRVNNSNNTATMPSSNFIAMSGTQLLTPLTETGQAADPQTAAMASLPIRNAPNPPKPNDDQGLPDEHQIGNEPAPVGAPFILLLMVACYAIVVAHKRARLMKK